MFERTTQLIDFCLAGWDRLGKFGIFSWKWWWDVGRATNDDMGYMSLSAGSDNQRALCVRCLQRRGTTQGCPHCAAHNAAAKRGNELRS